MNISRVARFSKARTRTNANQRTSTKMNNMAPLQRSPLALTHKSLRLAEHRTPRKQLALQRCFVQCCHFPLAPHASRICSSKLAERCGLERCGLKGHSKRVVDSRSCLGPRCFTCKWHTCSRLVHVPFLAWKRKRRAVLHVKWSILDEHLRDKIS